MRTLIAIAAAIAIAVGAWAGYNGLAWLIDERVALATRQQKEDAWLMLEHYHINRQLEKPHPLHALDAGNN